VIVAVAAAAVGAGLYAWWSEWNGSEETRTVTVYGNIEIRDAQLAFNGEEHIAEVLVEEGDLVEPGQVVARLQTDRLIAEIDRAQADIRTQAEVVRRLENGTRPQDIAKARANVVAAEARVHNAQRIVDRVRDTAGTGASSQKDLDDAVAQLAVEQAMLKVRQEELDLAVVGPREEDIAEAHARLAARRADLALLEDRLTDATLRAPAVGIIQSRILEPGEYATPARPVFTLALLDPKWARAYVPEPDLGKIAEGMPATVTSDSFPTTDFHGWVGFISPIAEFTPKTVQTTDLRTQLVYEVRVYVDDPDNLLRLGEPVTVRIDREGKRVSSPHLSDNGHAPATSQP
jgi:HlyD family secretion protein